MDQNIRLVFRPELQWPEDKFSKPFFTVPAWWRRFIFQILTPRDLTVYHYYLSVMNPAGVAWPAVRQVASDLGVKDLDTVRGSLRKLVDLGFLLQPSDFDRLVYSLGDRPLYQRPCVQYTVHRLLESGIIDGELYPTSNRVRTEHDLASDSVVTAGLKTMLGDMHPAYAEAAGFDRSDRDEVLADVLKSMLREHLKALSESAQVKAPKAINIDVFENLPESVKAALRLEQAPAVPHAAASPVKSSPAIRKKRGKA